MKDVWEVMDSLTQHGFVDLTSSLDLERCDQLPTAIGGWGDIYQGVTVEGRVISLKCLQPAFTLNKKGRKLLERAARELYVWSKCDHPGILPLTGLALYRGQLTMVSPWMEYPDLRSYLSARCPSSTNRLKLLTQLADAVQYLHNTGVVHGDLKGAPELILGEGTPTCETDVWALGMETFTNSEPYSGMHEATVWREIMKQVLPQRPEKDIPTGDKQADHLWTLLNQCWASDPLNRPTAADVRDKLQEIDSMYPPERVMGDPIAGAGR
ncbi:hypothetical protein FRC11_013150 [Ceratobasidium sp. 423]|nr:hypothetical protein FRC11_013150 [Ceratobasidium sp. 423]